MTLQRRDIQIPGSTEFGHDDLQSGLAAVWSGQVPTLPLPLLERLLFDELERIRAEFYEALVLRLGDLGMGQPAPDAKAVRMAANNPQLVEWAQVMMPGIAAEAADRNAWRGYKEPVGMPSVEALLRGAVDFDRGLDHLADPDVRPDVTLAVPARLVVWYAVADSPEPLLVARVEGHPMLGAYTWVTVGPMRSVDRQRSTAVDVGGRTWSLGREIARPMPA